MGHDGTQGIILQGIVDCQRSVICLRNFLTAGDQRVEFSCQRSAPEGPLGTTQ